MRRNNKLGSCRVRLARLSAVERASAEVRNGPEHNGKEAVEYSHHKIKAESHQHRPVPAMRRNKARRNRAEWCNVERLSGSHPTQPEKKCPVARFDGKYFHIELS